MVLRTKFQLFFVAISLVACSESVVDEVKSEVPPTPNGKALYTLNCASCHGADGKLGMSEAKDITQTKLSDEELITLIKNGKNGMPSFKELLGKSGEIEAVKAYVLTLKETK